MADIITQVESDIVAQLKAEVDNCRIDNDPKRTQAAPIARALVFHNSERPGQIAMNGRSQSTILQFSIDVQLSDQRIGGHTNIYPIVDSIKRALNGFSSSCSGPLRLTANDYQEMPSDSGIRWRYLMQFECAATWTK